MLNQTPHVWRTVILLVASTLLLAACSDDSKESDDRDTFGNVTPEQRANVPVEVEEVTIAISDGEFDVETITLQEDEPSIVHVENADGQAYRVQITPELVTPTDIPASAATDVKFTTPNADRYELELLPASGSDEALDSIDVIVQAAGAVQP
jgi:hypothetical protein